MACTDRNFLHAYDCGTYFGTPASTTAIVNLSTKTKGASSCINGSRLVAYRETIGPMKTRVFDGRVWWSWKFSAMRNFLFPKHARRQWNKYDWQLSSWSKQIKTAFCSKQLGVRKWKRPWLTRSSIAKQSERIGRQDCGPHHHRTNGAAKLLPMDILQRMKLLYNTFLVADTFNAILAGANNVRGSTASGRSWRGRSGRYVLPGLC